MRLVGIDIGGTFTDLALYDSEATAARRSTRSTRRPTTPAARSSRAPRALRARRDRACEPRRRPARDDRRDERGPRAPRCADRDGHRPRACATCCTSGATSAPSRTRSCSTSPGRRAPFVERQRRLTVPERLAPPTGEVIEPLDEEAVREAARELGAAGVEAIAVCFLFSYLDPAHELRAAEILREELPDCFVCTSARHHAAVPRVRALHDRGHERVRRPGHRRIPRAPGGGAAPRRGGRRDPRHALQRRRRQRRRGRGAPGDPHAVRARRRGARRAAGPARSSGGAAS